TLDGWMIPPEENRRVFWRAAGGRDVAIVEGMMGLFDGVEGASEEGSSAALAKALGLPVVLVIDAGGAVRSAAAMLRGFRDFDPALRLAGVIFNRVGGPGHLADLTAAAAPLGVPVLGGLPWEATVALPERHLGLVTAAEASLGPEAIRRLAALARDRLDLQRLLAETEVPEPRAVAPDSRTVQPRLRVAVARDAAFAFYYRENLTRLAAAGAELVDWGPLATRARACLRGARGAEPFPLARGLPRRADARELRAPPLRELPGAARPAADARRGRPLTPGARRGRAASMRRALAVLLLAGCSASSPGPGSSGPPARVVSLAPSITEIVYALGEGGRLVGVCAQCDHPPEVARIPRVGGYLTPSVEVVLATRPDLVIAVPSPGNREAVRALERVGVRMLVVHDRTLADLWTSIAQVADALEVQRSASVQ